MDFLEKYIHDNRKEMDGLEAVPTDKIWMNIPREKNKKKNGKKRLHHLKINQSNIWKYAAVAASILALVGWGLWFWHPPQNTISIADISPELAEKEMHLTQLISQKEKEINWENIDKKIHADILNDLKTIEQNTEQTKLDIAQFPDEKIIETLIRNYELKIRILENLNREIEKNKYHEEFEKIFNAKNKTDFSFLLKCIMLLLFLINTQPVLAQVEDSKTIKNEYDGKSTVSLRHAHGPMLVKASPDGKVYIEATISAKAKDRENLDILMNHFNIEGGGLGNNLELQTVSQIESWNTHNNVSTIKFRDGQKPKVLGMLCFRPSYWCRIWKNWNWPINMAILI